MVKKTLSILSVLLLVGYLAFSVTLMTNRHEDIRICRKVDLHISDSLELDLIDEEMILSMLQEHSIDPIGLSMDRIDLEKIEHTLITHPLIGKVEFFKTGGDMLRINIKGKVPLVRVMNSRGQDFYVDSKGEILPHRSLAVQLPLATGYIDHRFASVQLLRVVEAIDRS